MRVGLFIPCYIDQFYPHVGLATVELLQKLDVEVIFPTGQTCCGQPMANSGCTDTVGSLARRFADEFAEFDYVVCPSGSCTSMVRNHYAEYFDDASVPRSLTERTYELCEFIHDILKRDHLSGSFPKRVGFHQSCHGLRELRLASCSERIGNSFDKVKCLLAGLHGIELVEPQRKDECCGFGGTFAVNEYAISASMGNDRINDFEQMDAEVITAGDMSCLMHLQGLINRQSKPIRVMHVAEIMNEAISQ